MKRLLLITAILAMFHSAFSQAWIQRTNFSGWGRHRASGFSIGNRGYIGLGHVNGNNAVFNYKDWWSYDPSSDSWTQVADYPMVNYGAIVFSTATRGYAGGGVALGGEFYEYNPQTNAWTAIQNCPGTPGDQGCFSVNNKGYVIQGSALYEYDPSSGNWTVKQSAPIAFANWCTGFSTSSSGYIKSGASLYEYKPLQNIWIQRASFPGQTTNGGAAFVRSGKAYLISGFVGSLGVVTHEVWEYNPGNNTWTRMNDFPGTSRRFAVAFSINDRGYFGTGTNGINFNDFWEMNDNVSVNDLSSDEIAINVFPNPAVDFVNFEIGSNETFDAEVKVYNSYGQITDNLFFTNNSCRMDRNEKAAGIYFYDVVMDGVKVKSGKIIFR